MTKKNDPLYEQMVNQEVQYCIITTKDGRVLTFAGAPQIKSGESVKIKKIHFTKTYNLSDNIAIPSDEETLNSMLERETNDMQ